MHTPERRFNPLKYETSDVRSSYKRTKNNNINNNIVDT